MFKFNKSKKLFLIILLVVVIAGVAIWGGYWLILQRSPQKIVRKSFLKMRQVRSFHYKTDLNVKSDVPLNILNASQPQKVNFTISSEGDVDGHDIKDPKFSSNFGVKANMGSLSVDLTRGEIVGNNKALYFKIDKLLEFGIFDLKRIENKWYEISLADALGSNKISQDYSKIRDEFKNNVNREQLKELKLAADKANFLIITKTFPEETINGKVVYHYGYKIDIKGLKDFLVKSKKIISGTNFSPKESLELSKALAQLSNVGGEIWIGKKDNLIYKVTVNFGVKLEKDVRAQVSFTNNWSNFNKPIKIVVPEKAENIESISKLLSSIPNSSSSTSSFATSSTSIRSGK